MGLQLGHGASRIRLFKEKYYKNYVTNNLCTGQGLSSLSTQQMSLKARGVESEDSP